MGVVVIGVCGSSGAGKGYVSSVFASFGGYHIDTDRVYHELLEPVRGKLSPCAGAIASEFGGIVVCGVQIDRAALGKIVFADGEKRERLNRIAHAYIKRKTKRLIKNCSAPFAVVDAPLLFESGFDKMCDFTVCVTADDDTKVRRIVKRDGIDEDAARRRLASQIKDAELVGMCDFAIDNSYGRDVTEDVRKILKNKGLIT